LRRLIIWIYRAKAAAALDDRRLAIVDGVIFAVPVHGGTAVSGDCAPFLVAIAAGMTRWSAEN
jgi:hypothetical protein